MTRDELVSFVTTKCQLVEDDDVAAAKLFLSKRYELIFNQFLWKDSLCMVDVPFNPANPDNAQGIVSLPQQIDRVVALRTTLGSVRIHGLEDYYRIDFNKFLNQQGNGSNLTEFAILNPIWLTVRASTLSPAPSAVTTVSLLLDFLNGTSGATVQDFSTLVPNPSNNLDYQAYVASCVVGLQSVTSGSLPGANQTAIATASGGGQPLTVACRPGLRAIGGNFYAINGLGNVDPSAVVTVTVDGVSASTSAGGGFLGFIKASSDINTLTIQGVANLFVGMNLVYVANTSVLSGQYVTIQSTDPGSDVNQPVKVIWRDGLERHVQTSNLPFTLKPSDNSGFIEIEAVFKAVTIGSVQVVVTPPNRNITTPPTPEIVGTLLPSDTRSPSYQRIRLFCTPAANVTLNVLGKKPFVPLDYATEQPGIRNLDNCLIAFAVGDMLVRARHPQSESQPYYQEGTTLLDELAKLETVQAANNTHFTPDGGFGDVLLGPGQTGFGIYEGEL